MRGFAQKLGEVDIPRLFKAGWLRPYKMFPFLMGADGAVSNLKQNKVRYAVR